MEKTVVARGSFVESFFSLPDRIIKKGIPVYTSLTIEKSSLYDTLRWKSSHQITPTLLISKSATLDLSDPRKYSFDKQLVTSRP